MTRLVHSCNCPWPLRRAACTCGVGLGEDTANTLANRVLELEAKIESLQRAIETERLLRAAVEESRDNFHRTLQDLIESKAAAA